jgi:hypothetical protein
MQNKNVVYRCNMSAEVGRDDINTNTEREVI